MKRSFARNAVLFTTLFTGSAVAFGGSFNPDSSQEPDRSSCTVYYSDTDGGNSPETGGCLLTGTDDATCGNATFAGEIDGCTDATHLLESVGPGGCSTNGPTLPQVIDCEAHCQGQGFATGSCQTAPAAACVVDGNPLDAGYCACANP